MTCASNRLDELQAQGWTMQFMADEPRLSEAVEEYQNLGFEVHLEDVDPLACAQSQGCTSCFQNPEVAKNFKIIFTRPAGGGLEGDLF
jgi:hypothetical protein